MYKIENKNVKRESLPELFGQIIVLLIQLAFMLAVPVVIFAACVKVLFF